MGELGSRLTRVREARGLTLEDAERDTRISRRYLEALESEQFEVIPAPVYARGFLRSYSQYLGLDPVEMLDLFPRDEDEYPRQDAVQRPSMQNPAPAMSPSRPAWRRPPRPQPGRPRPTTDGRPPSPRPQPGNPSGPRPQAASASRPPQEYAGAPAQPGRAPGPAPARQGPPPAAAPRRREAAAPPPDAEPTIGIDIGVPSPARRINPTPQAQTRSATVLVVAGVGVLVILVLAFVISRLGGSSDTTNPGATATGTGTAAPSTARPTSGVPIEPGILPDLRGRSQDIATLAIQEGGWKVNVIHQKDASQKGIVIDQSPAPGVAWASGMTVAITVSDGPS